MISGKKAKKEIDAVTSASEFIQYTRIFEDLLEKTVSSNIKIRVILELHKDENQLIKQIEEYVRSGTIEVKFARHPLSHYFITDFNQVLMATSPEPPLGGHLHLWICDHKFCELTQENFEEQWLKSNTTPLS